MPGCWDSTRGEGSAAAKASLQNRLNELGQNLAIEIREW